MLAAVTGANGYVGSRIATGMRDAGWTVHELNRSGSDAVPFTLSGGPPAGYFEVNAVDVLVHCAWDFSLVGEAEIWPDNVDGSVRLLEQAHQNGTKIVFLSTISAFPGCRSWYGRAKLAVEQHAGRRLGGAIVRPGLVFGDTPGGVVGAMVKAATSLPVLPLIGNGKQILYPCHEDDLIALIVHLATGPSGATAPIVAANESGMALRDIVRLLVPRHRLPPVIPVPWRAVWAGLRAIEATGMRPGFRSDSVVSLVNQDPNPDFTARTLLPVAFRDFSSLAATPSQSGRQSP